jgi:hypothetical protein
MPKHPPAARQTQAKLVSGFLDDPDVRLIDFGSDPGTGCLVLRVHVRNAAAQSRLGLPPQIDGIPVRVIVADYRLER